MFTRVAACLGLLVAASLALSGCSVLEFGGGSSSEKSSDPDETTVAGEEQTPGADAELDSDALRNSQCLVGEWIVTESELQSFYDTVNVSQATFSVSGDMRLTFGKETYQFFPDFGLTLDIAGIDAVGEIVGDVSGSYTADEESVRTSYEDSDNVDFVITVMGQVFDGKELNDTFLAMFAINESPYTCEGDALTLGYQNVDGDAVVPVGFVRTS